MNGPSYMNVQSFLLTQRVRRRLHRRRLLREVASGVAFFAALGAAVFIALAL